MDEVLQERFVTCPYCWERISFLIDASPGSQQYVEDCEVCCRPVLIRCEIGEEGVAAVTVEREA